MFVEQNELKYELTKLTVVSKNINWITFLFCRNSHLHVLCRLLNIKIILR